MFSRLYEDPSPEFKQKVNNWLGKWPEKITKEWKKFITPNNSSAEKVDVMVKTHKKGNSVRVITSSCNTAVEKLSILVEKSLYPIAENLPSKIKDTNNMLEIIDQLHEFVLTDNFVLVSFDVVNMFPNIDDRSGLKSVKNILIANKFDMDSFQCIVEVSLMVKTSWRQMVLPRGPICLALMLTLPWLSMTL